MDIDSLYDIVKADDIMLKFGKQVDHENLQNCQLMLKKGVPSINSARVRNRSFFFSMEPPRRV